MIRWVLCLAAIPDLVTDILLTVIFALEGWKASFGFGVAVLVLSWRFGILYFGNSRPSSNFLTLYVPGLIIPSCTSRDALFADALSLYESRTTTFGRLAVILSFEIQIASSVWRRYPYLFFRAAYNLAARDEDRYFACATVACETVPHLIVQALTFASIRRKKPVFFFYASAFFSAVSVAKAVSFFPHPEEEEEKEEPANLFEEKEDEEMKKEVLLAAVQRDGALLRLASEFLKNDRDIVSAAVSHCGAALEHASENLRNDKTIVLIAVEQDGWAFLYASDDLKLDADVALAAIRHHGWALEHTDLKHNLIFVLAAVQQNASAIQYAPLKNEKNFAVAAVQRNSRAIDFLPDHLKQDPEIRRAAHHPL
ncbi:hypothetical protein CTAYLR_005153 [Chrysophaeum taylorii]|uniref:DUF4116 domain-containing protein n=1 Tax=Chrysophaeum taylorii TaxID=2483200 RepID=A0AAD7UMX1_9STRA|nr:hypothetical protein CTAYLR_005153 [Chrysophaeum taylorii]